MTDKAPAPTEHSDLLGGSSAERRYHCAASFRLEPGLPGNESPAASRGTRLHAAIAQMLSDQEPEGVSKVEVDDVLRPAMEAFDTLCDEHGVDRVIIERRVGTQIGDIKDTFGTIDVIGLGAGRRAVRGLEVWLPARRGRRQQATALLRLRCVE